MGAIPYSGGWLTPPGIDAPLAWLLLLPLLGALATAVLGSLFARRLGGRVAPALAVVAMLATLVAALVIFFTDVLPVGQRERIFRQPLFPLFVVGGIRVAFGLVMDPLSAVMVLLVTGLGSLIHLYAAFYMEGQGEEQGKDGRPRFFAFLNLFVFSMLLLVLADGFVPLFFGWEAVGACSYFLIGFWYRRAAAADAATKAFIVNRVGDAALLLGISMVLWGMGGVEMVTGAAAGQLGNVLTRNGPMVETGEGLQPSPGRQKIPVGPTLDFHELRDQLRLEMLPRAGATTNPVTGATADAARDVHFRPVAYLLNRKTLGHLPFLFVACVMLLLGAAGKSAQLPLFAWLPDAMAGPTPVSALIHAATLVTAGVYLLARLSFLFALSPGALTLVAVIGTLTALVGATAALVQNDLKRVLAYSTVSQLGYMFVALGAGAAGAGVFHVVTHGFFKACLFLAAGLVVHAVAATTAGADQRPDLAQDMRRMGGLARTLPAARWGYFAACSALAGLPFASGFFSKDLILTSLAACDRLAISTPLLLAALGVTSFLTSLYAFRSYYLIFFARPQRDAAHEAHHAGQHGGHEGLGQRVMTAVVLLLAVGAVVVGPALGWPGNWTANQGESSLPRLLRFLAPMFEGDWPRRDVSGTPAIVEWGMQLGGAVVALLGWAVARALYRDAEATAPARRRLAERYAVVQRLFATGWQADRAYHLLAVAPARALAGAATWLDRAVVDRAVNAVAAMGMRLGWVAAVFDRHVVDGVVDGVSEAALAAGRRGARLQNGRINSYVLGIAAGIAALVVLAYFLGS